MILQNAATCLKCNTYIFSRHRHDYVTCECGSLSVDGGMDYIRRSFKDRSGFVNHNIELPDELVQKCLDELGDGKYNDLGKLCAVLRTLKMDGYVITEGD